MTGANLRPDRLYAHMERKLDPAGVDRRIAELARRQHGSVERRQLLRLGLCGSTAIPARSARRRLRRLLAEHGIGQARDRSGFERDFVDFCAAHHLPAPQVNAVVCGEDVDFCWPAARVVVETDGYEFHHTRFAFARDRRRDQALVAAGWRVIRVPTLTTGRRALARDLRRLLS